MQVAYWTRIRRAQGGLRVALRVRDPHEGHQRLQSLSRLDEFAWTMTNKRVLDEVGAGSMILERSELRHFGSANLSGNARWCDGLLRIDTDGCRHECRS